MNLLYSLIISIVGNAGLLYWVISLKEDIATSKVSTVQTENISQACSRGTEELAAAEAIKKSAVAGAVAESAPRRIVHELKVVEILSASSVGTDDQLCKQANSLLDNYIKTEVK